MAVWLLSVPWAQQPVCWHTGDALHSVTSQNVKSTQQRAVLGNEVNIDELCSSRLTYSTLYHEEVPMHRFVCFFVGGRDGTKTRQIAFGC